MPADKKIIAVAGATGHQGLGLVRAIVSEASSEFTVRALTNDTTSETLSWFKKNNVEVCNLDIADEDALTKALSGVWGLFAVTFYWPNLSPEEEIRQAKSMACAAKKAGVKHIVWSTLEDTRKVLEKTDAPTIGDKYKVPPFDAKSEADRYFAECGVPTTYLITPFFWDNFIDMGMGPRKTPDGTYKITLPMGDKRLAGIASEDIGRCVLGIFRKPDEYKGKKIGIRSEDLTMRDMAEKMSKVLGKEIRYQDMSLDEYRRQNIPGAKELGNTFQYYRENEEEVIKVRCSKEACKLCPNIMKFDQWLSKYKDSIPLGA